MKTIKTYLPIVLAMICWSLSFVWIKDAYIDFTPITLVETRLLAASILLLIIGFFSKQLQLIKRGDVLWFLALAFFEPFLYFMGESFGLTKVSSTLGAVIVSTIPLFAPIFSYFLVKEKISRMNIAGILLSLVGVLTIVLKKDGGLIAPLSGILLMFLAVFAAIFYSIILKKLAHRYTGTSIVTYQSMLGFIYFLPFFFMFEYEIFREVTYSTKSLIAAAELSIFASVLAFLFFTASIKKIGVMKSNVFANLIPALTAVLAFFVLGDELNAKKVIGIIIVIAGLFVCELKLKKKSHAI